MKILIITPFRENVGGVEVITAELEQVLSKQHLVEYLTTDGFEPGILDKIFIKILGLPYITRKRYKNLKEQPDVVIANGEFAFGISHPKLINYFHGSYFAYASELKHSISLKNRLALWWRAYLQEKGLSKRKIIAVSTYLSDVLKKRGAVNIKVINNPLDLNMFKPTPLIKEYDFIFIGRYDYWGKGFDVLEKFFPRDKRSLIVSDKKNFEMKSVTYVFKPERKEIPLLLNKAKILFFPSRFEAFGQVPAEALASGLPVLMRPTGIGSELSKTIPEFIINDFENIKEIEEKIRNLNENYVYFSHKARTFAELHFSKANFEKEWLKTVSEI